MKLMPIMKYAESQGVGIEGETLFLQHMPELSGTPALMLKNSLDGTDIDYELPGYRKGKFQAVIRCKANRYEEGDALATLISDVLNVQEMTLGNFNYRYIRPIHEPIAYQLSDGANYEFSVNFAAVYAIVS